MRAVRIGRGEQVRMPESATVIQEWLENSLGIGVAVQKKLLMSALILGGVAGLRWALLKVLYRRTDDLKFQYRARKVSAYVSAGVAIFAVGQVWMEGFRQFGTYFGLLSAGLAIALKDLVASIAGWAYLLWRHPFEVGDRVEIGGHSGDVIDIRLFRFTLMEIGNWVHDDQSTGRVIHIPNSRIFSEVIANYSKGFEYIWNEIPVTVTFESNWEKAKRLLQEIADRHGGGLTDAASEGIRRAARKALIQYRTLTPRVWTRVGDSGVVLTIRYLCGPRARRETAELIWEDILRAFHPVQDIDFAYPTVRRYINSDEGKPGTGGPSA